ncbi:MAG TPA: hypothetical protein ENI61_02585 [Ignavibacteria bacterium]|nr:hypothetical protein [Ignavibacteria bacterium]
MNIHPLFVHFPIALLVIYAFMEIIPQVWVFKTQWWNSTKMFLSIIGILSIAPTLITGDIAEDAIIAINPKLTPLIETHATMAAITAIVFLIPAIAYATKIIETTDWHRKILLRYKWYSLIANILHKISIFTLHRWAIFTLATLGIILLTITGGLGASIVYGPDFDPIISFIYGLFF